MYTGPLLTLTSSLREYLQFKYLFLWGRPPSTDVPTGPYPTYVEQTGGRVVPVVQAYAYTKYIGLLSLQVQNSQ